MNAPNIPPPAEASKTLAELIRECADEREDIRARGGWDEESLGRYRPLRFLLNTMRDIKPTVSDRYFVKGWLTADSLTAIGGPPKHGKSFVALDMAGHIALGIPWRGFKVRQGNVLYIAAEGATGFKDRMVAWRNEHVAEDGDPPFLLITSRLDLVKDVDAFIEDVEWQTGSGGSPHVLFIDTVARTFSGDENSTEHMVAYVQACDKVRERLDCSVVAVHHFGYEGTRLRGSSALPAAVDTMISVKKDDATKVIVSAIDFAKDLADGTTTSSKLRVVEIGLDEDGDPVETCIIEPTDEQPAEQRSKSSLSAPRQIALIALKQAAGDHGEVPPASNHIPTNTRTVGYALWRETAYKRGISDGDQHAKNAAFNRAAKWLMASGKVGCWDNQVWPVEARP